MDCHQIVTKSGAKWSKTVQVQKKEIIAILRLAKGFNWIFYQIAKRRFYFSRPQICNRCIRLDNAVMRRALVGS
jgi:hypothetical protein